MSQTTSVVVFDREDPITLKRVTEALAEYQSVIIPCESDEAVRVVIGNQRVDVVVVNFTAPFEKPFHLLAEIQTQSPQTEVIFVARFDEETMRAWMTVIQRGAYEFLPKPLDREELKYHIMHAVEKRHSVEPRRRAPAESVKVSGTTKVVGA